MNKIRGKRNKTAKGDLNYKNIDLRFKLSYANKNIFVRSLTPKNLHQNINIKNTQSKTTTSKNNTTDK